MGFPVIQIYHLPMVFFRNFVIFKVDLMQDIGLFNASTGGFAHNLNLTRTHKIVVSSTQNKLDILVDC